MDPSTPCYIDWGDLRYRVDIDPDDDATPAEFECYDTEDIAAFRAGSWQYVDITVTVECPGIDIIDQPGAVEYDTMPNTTIDIERLLNEYPVPDMILTCRRLLADLRSRLGAVALTEPDLLMVPVSVTEARTLHNALDLANNHWDEALSIAETAAEQPERRAEPTTPATMNIEPTAAGYHGIAVIARAEQATYRKLGDRLLRSSKPPKPGSRTSPNGVPAPHHHRSTHPDSRGNHTTCASRPEGSGDLCAGSPRTRAQPWARPFSHQENTCPAPTKPSNYSNRSTTASPPCTRTSNGRHC